jgi:hypothetical protein
MVSKQVEMVGLTPIPPLMTDPDAIEGYESWYAVANTRTLPYLPYRTYDDQGRQLKEPHRPGVDPNLLPVSQSIAMFREGIQATTAVPASRLGDIDPVTRSGKAIRELTQNSQQSTSNFMQNLIRSLRYEGQIENNLLYPIYGARPGRLVRIMTGMGESQTIMVHDAPKESQLVQQAQAVAKLTPDAKFNINIKVARDFDTRRDQEQQTLGQLIAAEPQLMTWFGDLWFKNQDGPGHQAMAERAKVMLAPPIQKLLAATAQGQNFDPEKAALQAQLAQAQQQLQAAGMAIQTKQVEQQGKLQITQVQEAADLEKHRQDNETKLAVAELGAKVDRLALFLEERARLGSQQHDAAMAGAQMGHDAQQTQQQQRHEMNMAHQGVAASLVTPTPPSANGEGAPQA